MTRSELAAALALLVALAWTLWDASQVGKASSATPAAIASPALAGPPKPLPENAFADIVHRSLFTPSRRADFSSVANHRDAVAGQVLRGTLMGANGAVALFEPLNGGPGQRLRIGSMIGGYRIIAVEEASVALERDGKRRALPIDESPPPVANATSQVPGASPDFPQAPSRAPTLDEIEQ